MVPFFQIQQLEWYSWIAMKLSVDIPKRVSDQLKSRARRAARAPMSCLLGG